MGEKFSSILIATDGSQHTKNAVKHGLALAKLSNAKVYAVYVIDIAAFASIPVDATWENMHEFLKKEGEAAIKNVEEDAASQGIKIEKIILEGNPAQEIVKFASANNIDLIVMGTLGKSGLERFLLGSVAEKVIRTASCPVMVVRSRVAESKER